MSDTSGTPPTIDELLSAALARVRAREHISARALAARCEAMGVSGIDRQRIANLEGGRGRPWSVSEWLGLAYVLDFSPVAFLTGRVSAEDEEASRQVRVADGLDAPYSWVEEWVAGEAPRPTRDWSDWTPPPTPEVTVEEAMRWVRDLADRHGLRVTFEPTDRRA